MRGTRSKEIGRVAAKLAGAGGPNVKRRLKRWYMETRRNPRWRHEATMPLRNPDRFTPMNWI